MNCFTSKNVLLFIGLLIINAELFSQSTSNILTGKATLRDCIVYALKHQPVIAQSVIDEDINKQDVNIALSAWLPQLTSEANFTHYEKLPVAYFPDLANPSGPKLPLTTGVNNSSALNFSANQVIFNNEVLFASKTAKYYRQRASQHTQSNKTDLIANVSKAFYDVILSQQALDLINEDIGRLNKNLSDAYSQYQSGLNDKIDYKRANIALNSAQADKKATIEAIKAKYAYLEQLMAYPPGQDLLVSYDSTLMLQEIPVDTLTGLNYHRRIEYQLLQTQLSLQKSTLNYYKNGFLPSLSAFADYNINYGNNQFSQLYNTSYPTSYYGLKLTLPLFGGLVRHHNVNRANLQYEQMQMDTLVLRDEFTTEYLQALSAYKSNLASLKASEQNVDLAREVYNMVTLQYQKGVKSYLEVIVSETDLRSAQISRLNALFRLLSSKVDLEKASGTIPLNY